MFLRPVVRAQRPPLIVRVGVALLTLSVAIGVSLLFRPLFVAVPFILFFAAVAINAAYGGLYIGLLSVLLSLLLTNYFLIPPYDAFAFALDALVRGAIFVFVASLISWLSEARQRAEMQAYAQAERFAVTLTSIGDGVIATDAAGRVTFLNPVAEVLTGWSRNDAMGKAIGDVFDIINARTRQPTENPVLRVLRDGTVVRLANHTLLRAKDGTERPIDDSGAPIRDVLGQLIGVVLVFRDVTERIEAERQRAEALARERAVQQRTALLAELGVALTSSLDYTTTLQQLARTVVPSLADFCIIYVERPDRVIERAVMVHRDPEVEALLHNIQARDAIYLQGPNPVARVLRTGTPDIAFSLSVDDAKARTNSDEQRRAAELLRPRSSIVMPLIARGHTLGAITFAMTEAGRPYTDDDVVLAQEVAQRAALAIDNAQLYQQEQNAVQLRDQFLSIAAHELKTPLTVLTGQVQLMLRRAERDGEVSERGRRSLSVMNAQVGRLNIMVRSLLDVSRIETGQLGIERTRLDICALVRRVVSEVRTTFENRQIEVDYPDTPLFIRGDAIRLEQVLLNLILNAFNYSEAPAPATLTVRQDGNWVCVAVKDRGIGIPASALPHLFTRFFRAENAEAHHHSGMGIGLSVVKEIVTLHGGDVQVESVEGQGSTFTISLLRAADVETTDAEYNR